MNPPNARHAPESRQPPPRNRRARRGRWRTKLSARLGREPGRHRPLAHPPQEPRRPQPRRPPLRLRRRGRGSRATSGHRRTPQGPDVEPFRAERFDWPEPGPDPLEHRPVIIGAGPAGLFAGYLLALDGYRPLILERGREVKDRVADVRRFDAGGPLDPESNYLFGEGGAGTFSDGKLTSRGTGPDVQRVLEILADCHGKPSILYEQKPHLGSNRLPLVVRTLRRKFEELGGEVRFSCRVEDLEIADGRLRGRRHQLGHGSRPTSPSWPSATARGTRTGCSCGGGSRWNSSRSSSA